MLARAVEAPADALRPGFADLHAPDRRPLAPLRRVPAHAQLRDGLPGRARGASGRAARSNALAVQRFEGGAPAPAVPLLPWVSLPYERIDESVRKISTPIERHGRGMTLGADVEPAPDYEQYTYPASFARAIAEDLAASGLFEESVCRVAERTAIQPTRCQARHPMGPSRFRPLSTA